MANPNALAAGQGGTDCINLAPQTPAPASARCAKTLHPKIVRRKKAIAQHLQTSVSEVGYSNSSAQAPRKRGGQPGNANALKHGRYKRECREFRAAVYAYLCETYAMLDELGAFRSRPKQHRRGAPFGNSNALKHGKFSRRAPSVAEP